MRDILLMLTKFLDALQALLQDADVTSLLLAFLFKVVAIDSVY